MPKTTLSRKLLFTNLALVMGLLVVGVTSLWGLVGLRRSTLDAVDEYEEVRFVEKAIVHMTSARVLLKSRPPDAAAIGRSIDGAMRALKGFLAFQAIEGELDKEHQDQEIHNAGRALTKLKVAMAIMRNVDGGELPGDLAANVTAQVDAVLMELAILEQETSVAGTRAEAKRQASTTIVTVLVLCGLIVAGAITVSVVGYRSVMRPLRRLQAGVRRLAEGRLDERIPPTGDLEIAELAGDFNRMASELDTLYRNMEEKVEFKSRELVQSERLASVGFLAAGVAHEINNPLGIISGYTEMSLKWLSGDPDERKLTDARAAMEIVRQEAFRCKGITEQLLSLARLGDHTRANVCLAQITREVAAMVGGLKKYSRRQIEVSGGPADGVMVFGSEPELKQVVLNLTVNALEATNADTGKVHIDTACRNGWIEMTVSDDGCGLAPDELSKVFEPFFTHRQRSAPRGIGLGLSISHAIVQSHGGTIVVASDGIGRGSRFTMKLPVTRRDESNATG